MRISDWSSDGCSSDLYDEANIRDWYGQASPRGNSLAERAQRAYIRWHLARMFADGKRDASATPAIVIAPEPDAAAIERAAHAHARSQRPLLLGGSQAHSEERRGGKRWVGTSRYG